MEFPVPRSEPRPPDSQAAFFRERHLELKGMCGLSAETRELCGVKLSQHSCRAWEELFSRQWGETLWALLLLLAQESQATQNLGTTRVGDAPSSFRILGRQTWEDLRTLHRGSESPTLPSSQRREKIPATQAYGAPRAAQK